MPENPVGQVQDGKILLVIIKMLVALSKEERRRIIQALGAFFGVFE